LLGGWLDLMILEVFSNLWFYDSVIYKESSFKLSSAPFLHLIACKLLIIFHFVYSINCFSIVSGFIQ